MNANNTVDSTTQSLARVDEVLERFFSLSTRRAASLAPAYEALWKTLRSNTNGGKRFRPRMVMTAYEGLGGHDTEAAAHVGASFELLHTALIVHDDVIDRDFVRRGIPNVSGSYRDIAHTAGLSIPTAEHRGMSVAVIAGDLALTGSFRLMGLTETDSQTRARLVDMERLKTAVYSFEAPLQAGAVLAGAPETIVSALGEFGRNIGIAYQIVDDLLGVFGDEMATGKTTIGDIREGKRTALIAFASTQSQWATVSHLVGKSNLTPAEAHVVREALEQSGARTFAERLAGDYADRAVNALSDGNVPSGLIDELTPIVAAVLERVR